LATGGEDHKIFLWDLESGQKMTELVGHNGDILTLEFNHDGSILASGSNDHGIKLWDVKKQERIESLRGHAEDVVTLDFNEDGSLLASGSGNELTGGESEIILWNVKKNKKVRSWEGNEGFTRKVIFRNNRIFSIGNEPSLRVFDASNGLEEYSFIPLGLDDYIIFTPDNYYTSTKLKDPIVHFVQGLDVYSFENFDLQYNRPDIILERMGSQDQKLILAYRKVYQRRLHKLGFDEAQFSDDFHLPEVEIVEKDLIPLITHNKVTEFGVIARDKKNNLSSLHITVNNVPLYGSTGLPLPGGNSVSEKISVRMSQGRNKILISCINDRGVESHQETLEIICQKDREVPDLYLVVVGVSEYADPAMNLNYAVKDGQDILKMLTGNDKLFGAVHLDTLFNERATKRDFQALREGLFQSDVDDYLIIFMAGHGILDQDFNFNFASYDIDPQNPELNGISFSNIESLVDGIPARKKLVLIDACHSGELDKEEIEEIAHQMITTQTRGGTEIKSQSFEKIKMNVFNFYGINNSTVKMICISKSRF